MDLLKRGKSGLYVGAGLVVDRDTREGTEVSTSETSTESDTTVTSKNHDHGKHEGVHHEHKSKRGTTTITTTIKTYGLTTITLGGVDLGLSPSYLLGISAKHGLFAEGRVLFGTDVTSRVGVGVRF